MSLWHSLLICLAVVLADSLLASLTSLLCLRTSRWNFSASNLTSGEVPLLLSWCTSTNFASYSGVEAKLVLVQSELVVGHLAHLGETYSCKRHFSSEVFLNRWTAFHTLGMEASWFCLLPCWSMSLATVGVGNLLHVFQGNPCSGSQDSWNMSDRKNDAVWRPQSPF